MAYQPMDELDGRPGRNGTHQFHLRPLGELVDGHVEVAIAPCARGNEPRMSSPQNNEGPSERDGLQLLR
jgi:hypothetical protein